MNFILVIDDSPTIRTSVEFTVKDFGYPVKHAGNGADALEKIKQIKGQGGDMAQDEESCIVFGMSNEAIKRGAADMVKNIMGIIDHLRGLARYSFQAVQ